MNQLIFRQLKSVALLLTIMAFQMECLLVPTDAQTVLIAMERQNERLSTFSAFDGALVTPEVFRDSSNLLDPISVIDSGRGSFLVSDTSRRRIAEYAHDGTFIGNLLESMDGLYNNRGIEVRDGMLYIANGISAEPTANTIQILDLDTNVLTSFPALGNCFDVKLRGQDMLVNTVEGNTRRFDFAGSFLSEFYTIPPNDIDPRQICETSAGDLLISSSGSDTEIFRFASNGMLLTTYLVDDGSSISGIYELGNGNILWTNVFGVYSYDPVTDESTQISGGSYGFVEEFTMGPITVPVDSFTVTAGNLASGGLVEISSSDNSDLSVRRSNTDILSRTVIEVSATGVSASPSSLEFTVEASVFARNQVDQAIDFYNYSTMSFEEVDTRAAARFSDSVVAVSPTGDLSRFVSPSGEIQARIRYRSVNNMRQRFSSNVDHLFWSISQ